MFSTTSTTVICLVCAAFMPIPQLASFAIFAALAVTLDYCLVITGSPRRSRVRKVPRGRCCCIKCEHVCCARTAAAGGGGGKGDGEAPPPRRMVRLRRQVRAGAYRLRYASFFG